jgi:hypothetical protein
MDLSILVSCNENSTHFKIIFSQSNYTVLQSVRNWRHFMITKIFRNCFFQSYVNDQLCSTRNKINEFLTENREPYFLIGSFLNANKKK